MPGLSIFRRLRIFQVRASSALIAALGARSFARPLLTRLRKHRLTASAINALLGYRRIFASFADAQACASKYIQIGHEHPDEIRYHSSIADTLRESDYPLLFYMTPLASNLCRVFDLGGNVGNLFYAYQHAVNFPPDLIWTVYDLPVKKPMLESLARERAESRVRFSQNLAEASGADIFIASGSLHYFERSLDELLASLDEPPPHVFINRSPFTNSNALITVQDNRSYLVPCKLHSRPSLISGMQRLGYTLICEWPVHERRLLVPLYPDLSARTYSGFYFRRHDSASGR